MSPPRVRGRPGGAAQVRGALSSSEESGGPSAAPAGLLPRRPAQASRSPQLRPRRRCPRSSPRPRPRTEGCELWRALLVPTPAAPESKAGAAGGPQTPGARSSAESRVLTFPLGPPPPPPLGLAFELAAQPSGRSAGAQDRCHGRAPAGGAGEESRLQHAVLCRSRRRRQSASADPGAAHFGARSPRAPAASCRAVLRLPLGGEPREQPAPRAPLCARTRRRGQERCAAGRALPPRLRSASGGLSGSALPARRSDFGTSAGSAAAATLRPITQGACLFAAAKSN